jgi:Zn-dependent protease
MINITIRNLRLKIGFSFFVMVALSVILIQTDYALMSLAAIALHEAGHLLAMIFFRRKIRGVRFGFFGIEIEAHNNLASNWQDLVVSICGPLANGLSAAVFFLVYKSFSSPDCFLYAGTQLSIGIFNLLPITGLDGGNLLKLGLLRFFSEERTDAIGFVVSVVACAGLVFILLYTSKTEPSLDSFSLNYSMVAIIFYLVIRLFTNFR